ncbi:GAF domain-containing sensor histidine kinase [Roseibacillus ishigakijimensis]|uniref:histidine kinase n=1 Tax=Roseibacillus ishigakijimensis TaxID=454146 RepID=A0A934RNM6_9BACT|nr:GAF domain-containing sensor histidine kinase [Roseibacillus ishigakijimensis]MBK1832977.1 GAF domain-containing sensor histidine kinase [Roseibacillus ishigakijimensis]
MALEGKKIENKLANSLSDILGELDSSEFDRIAQLASRAVQVPVSLVTIVESERQFFIGAYGLVTPYCETRETPLSHSFCRRVVASRNPVVVTNAREDKRFCDNPAIEDLGVVAYLGFPLMDGEGQVLGAFCLIDTVPRHWSDDEVMLARDFAALSMTQIQFESESVRHRNLIDVLTHDLKTPLSSLDFSARLLMEQREEFKPETAPLLDSMLEATGQAFAMIQQAGFRQEKALKKSSCRLGVVLDVVLASLTETAKAKGIAISVKTLSQLEVPSVDEWLVERVLENLVSNAIKYSPVGGQVSIEMVKRDRMAGFLVRDSGPGFSKRDIPRLYQRYSQLTAKPTGGESSSGLGLSIAKRLTTQTGGQLELISQPGESACFEVLFPQS